LAAAVAVLVAAPTLVVFKEAQVQQRHLEAFLLVTAAVVD
jgi:hypothetical protein